MHLYRCKVNLNGNSDNQVILDQVTAAEIRLLHYIHGKSENGKEPVIEIEHTANTTRSDQQERSRLTTKYAELELGQGAAIVARLFGVPGVPLPQVYEPPAIVPEADIATEEQPIDEVITQVEPTPVVTAAPEIKRTRLPKKTESVVDAIVG